MSELGMAAMRAEQDVVSKESVQAATAGQMLRAAREASGLHIAALAVSMKVPVKKLEALEADRLDLLPDAVFVRALAASVCRTLKIDSATILERLPQNAVPRLDAESRSINAPFHSPGDVPGWTLPAMLKNPALIVVMVLLVGVLMVAFLPESSRPTAAQVDTPVASAPPDTAASAVATPAESFPVVPQQIATNEVPNSPISAPSKAIEVPVAVLNMSALKQGGVSFKQKESSWVEVTDAKGTVLLRRVLAAGEALTVLGDLPLSVVVGRVDATEVEVRGKPFSLTGIAKDNVARFEVK